MQLGHTVYRYTVEPYPLMNETLQQLEASRASTLPIYRRRCVYPDEKN